jgi:hypothetical protein
VVFKLCVQESPQKSGGGEATDARASRQHVEPKRAPAPRAAKELNSAQRRSKQRMDKYIQKIRSGKDRSTSQAVSAESAAAVPAQVDLDVRTAGAAQETAQEARRGCKRAVDESSTPAPPSTLLKLLKSYKGKRVVESTSGEPTQQQRQKGQRLAVEPTARPPRPSMHGGRVGRGLAQSSEQYRRMLEAESRGDYSHWHRAHACLATS